MTRNSMECHLADLRLSNYCCQDFSLQQLLNYRPRFDPLHVTGIRWVLIISNKLIDVTGDFYKILFNILLDCSIDCFHNLYTNPGIRTVF
jgi:hypothetical protein